jgi:DNA-binding MarR family transcriptional regulator
MCRPTCSPGATDCGQQYPVTTSRAISRPYVAWSPGVSVVGPWLLLLGQAPGWPSVEAASNWTGRFREDFTSITEVISLGMSMTTSTPPAAAGKVVLPESDELQQKADELLGVMASLRRSGGLLARRPVELSSLTGSQIDLVRVILRRPGVSVNQAAEELRLAPNTVSTLVRQLSEQRLLVRRADPADRRVARLDLTPGMRRKVAAFRDRRVASLVGAIRRLPVRDQRRVSDTVELLNSLAEQLLEEEQTARQELRQVAP